MEDNKKYGVIHELGDYSQFNELKEDDQEKYKVQLEQERLRKEENENK